MMVKTQYLNIFGTSQEEHCRKTLLQQSELREIYSYTNFLIFSYLYSNILKPYKSQNVNLCGTFFEHDDIFIYSFILHTNINKIGEIVHTNIVDLKQAGDIYASEMYIKNLTILITEYIQLTFSWFNNLSNGNIVKNELLQCAIDDFVPKLYVLNSIVSTLNKRQPKEYYQNFLNLVEYGHKTYNFPINRAIEISNDNKNLNDYVFDTFRDVSELILIELEKAKNAAKKTFNDTLYNGSHDPHIALFFTFIKLLDHINSSFYNIIDRHLEYYYEGVLMFKRKEEVKDKALIFCLYEGNDIVKTIPKFTKILGGKDNKKQDIVFQTNEHIQISNSRIKTIRTILYSEIIIDDIDKFPTSYVEIATYDMKEVYSKNQKLYLFSKKDSNASKLSKTKNINYFSFVFFSSILKLKEGEREISIKFLPTKASLKYLIETLKRLNLFIVDENKTLEVFANILSKTVLFKYTTTDSLVTIDKKNVSFKWSAEDETFVAKVSICSDMPSFTSAKIETLKIDNKDHYLQMIYVNETLLWASNLFRNLRFFSIKLFVDVKNCRNLILQNDFGLIENNISFEPFGPIPELGSSFFIGSEEIFNKNLKSLTLNIEWENLPENFESYYKNYDVNIKNSDFKINISFLQQGYWYPLEKSYQQEFLLFDSVIKNNDEKLKNTRTINEINLSLLQLNRKHNFDFSTPFLYSGTTGGFLRIQLCRPNIAFAHSIYPQILTHKHLLNKSKLFRKEIDNVEINIPYTPKIKNFNIDYKAGDEINCANYQNNKDFSIICTQPFGYERIKFIPEKEIQDSFEQKQLLIENAYATINIELTHIFNSTFTLYISIDEVSILENTTVDKPIWRYLSNNQWCVFDKNAILFDTTDNFKKSGFIKIKTPKFIQTQNTICISSCENTNWIQILFVRPKKYLPTIIGIFTDALLVTRISNNTQNKISAGGLKNIKDPNFKNVKIIHPFSSFGGKNEETKEEMYLRIGERLNHKDRTVTIKDYENIILEKFPEIMGVKCLNHTCSNKIREISPGYVTIVVIMNNILNVENNRKFPQASVEFLNIIKKEIQKHSSPFVKINVINPIFEKIKFVFKVRMHDHKQSDIFVKKLNSELKNFISPWLYSTFNNFFSSKPIKALDVIRFIKSREYVSNISNFIILKIYKNETTIFKDNKDEIFPSFPHSFFYSADTHNIIVDETLECKGNEIELNNMNIEQDFIVGPVSQSNVKNGKENIDNVSEGVDDFYMYLKN